MEIRDHIIQQASQLFMEQGIKSVRMDDIAAQCGVSKRTIYEQFHDREDLVEASMEYVFENGMKEEDEMLRNCGNVLEMFWNICNINTDKRQRNNRVFKEIKKFYPNVFNRMLISHFNRLRAAMSAMLRRGMDEGLMLPDLDAEIFSYLIVPYIFGMNIAEVDPSLDCPVASHEAYIYAITLFLRGMTTEKGRRYIDRNILKIENNL